MISVQEAEKRVKENFLPQMLNQFTESRVDGAHLDVGLTGEALLADREYPPFDRATMDGICVQWDKYQAGQRVFEMAGVCAAGTPRQTLYSATMAMEIMTGAALPVGADLVIPYEHLKIEGATAKLTVEEPRAQFENVHRKGSDCAAGDEILSAGSILNGPRWGIAASFGYEKIRVQAKPKIKIISTGDELVEVGQRPLPHQIRGSNAVALLASLRQHGFENVEVTHLIDDQKLLREDFINSTKQFDVLIYTGGVSKGKFDYLPSLWQEMGVENHFHMVSQRPGKPLWFGTDQKNKTTVFGLPGNPVSALVCLHRYVLANRVCYAKLSKDIEFKKDLTLFLPARIEMQADATLLASPLKIQNSGEFTALAESDGFIELPRGKDLFLAGESYRFFPWGKWN